MYEFILRLEGFFVQELKTFVDKKAKEINPPKQKPPPQKPMDILE